MTDLRRAVFAVFAFASLAACGHSAPPARHEVRTPAMPTLSPGAFGSPGSTATAPVATVPTKGAKPSAAADRTGAPAGATGQPSAPAAQPTATKQATTVKVTLSKTCVRPGDSLTVDAMSSRPNMFLIYDTAYPDNKDGATHGGIDKDGKTDGSGHYSSTFTVDKGTPVGEASVVLSVIDGDGSAGSHKPFRVALTC
jgi:hypothetical protein